MKLLITGGAGFIGSNLVHHLLATSEHELVVLDKLTYAGNLESLEGVLDGGRCKFVKGDIASAEDVRQVYADENPDGVLHLAAESHVDRSIDSPGEFLNTNVVGTYQLLQCAREHWGDMSESRRDRFRFLHVSTDEVFGSLAPDEAPFSESTPYSPRSPYSASKAASDHFVRAWLHTFGLPVLVTNCSNNYGPFQFPEKLIPVVILNCLKRTPIPVYGKGENVRDWLFVVDHCRALMRVFEEGAPGETYTVGGSCELRNIDLIHMLCSLVDEELPKVNGGEPIDERGPSTDLISFVADRPGHDLRYAINSQKIRQELGWEPTETIDSGLRQTVRWYLEHRNWWERILTGDYKMQRFGRASK